MADWKDTLKKAWEDYGADVLAGGAGAVGGWFLPHLFWDKPSYVNKGASAALLAAISIAGQRGIKDALKEQHALSAKDRTTRQAASFLGGLIGDINDKKFTQQQVQQAEKRAGQLAKDLRESYSPGAVATRAGVGAGIGIVGYPVVRGLFRGSKLLAYKKAPWLIRTGLLGTPGKSHSVPHPYKAAGLLAALNAFGWPVLQKFIQRPASDMAQRGFTTPIQYGVVPPGNLK